MQTILLDTPKNEDYLPVDEHAPHLWFTSPPYQPENISWSYLTTEKSKEMWRLSRSFEWLFNLSGDWISASHDREDYITSFQQYISTGIEDLDTKIFVVKGRSRAVFTNVEGFLSCWPRLRLEEHKGYIVFPLDVSFYLRVSHICSAHLAKRVS